MAISAKDYYEGILKNSGSALPAEKQKAFMEMVSDPDFEKVLATEVIAPRLRHDDYSRQMDAIAKEKKTWTDWYTGALAKTADDQKVVEAARAKVAAYEAQYGQLTDAERQVIVQQPTGEWISKKDLDAKLSEQGNQYLTLLEWAATKPIAHYQQYGQPLDVGAVKKLAVEKGLSLDQAYAEVVAPMATERQSADLAAKIKAAREEGAREFASTHQIPMDTAQKTEHHVLFNRKPESELPPAGPLREAATVKSFVEAWNSAPAGTSGE